MPQPTPIAKPKALIYQEFRTFPAPITQPFRAHISGPVGFTVDGNVAAEKPLGSLGAYDPLADQAFAWPSRPAGGLVDREFTRLRIEKARLLLFQDPLGSGLTVAPVNGKSDRIRIDGSDGFKANGSSFPRFAALFDRDVAPGDRVSLRGVVSGETYEVETYVRDLAADQVAASIGAATADAANESTQTAGATVTLVAGDETCNDLVASLAGYDAWRDGATDDVYTVTVTKGSVGGDLSTGELRVTTASGLDDDLVVVPAEVDDFFSVGGRGLLLSFECTGHPDASLSSDDLVVGQSWTVAVSDNYTQPVPTSGGTYTGTSDATYIVTCTRGGQFGAQPQYRPQLSVTTTSGVDNSGPTNISATATAYPVGTKGVTITFAAGPAGIRKGDTWYISAVAAKDGRFSTIVLGRSLPAGLLAATDLDLTLSLERDIDVPANRVGFEPDTNWEQSATELTVKAGIFGYDPSVTDGGVVQPLDVLSGNLYVSYRAWLSDLCDKVTTVTSSTYDSLIPGRNHPDNPLKYAVGKALANSNGVEVKVTGVCDPDDDESWIDVLTKIAGEGGVYGLVPLTTRRSVLNLYAAHVAAESTPEKGQWRAMWASLVAPEVLAIADASKTDDEGLILGTIADDPNTTGTQYTLFSVPAANVDFEDLGVRPGDVVRYDYGTAWGESTWNEYTVDAVLNGNTLRLLSGPVAAVTIARKAEIWRALDKDARVAAAGESASAFASTRVCAVWPDRVGSGGLTVPGYHLCAALAGLRSGVVPHQGLSTATLLGFDDLSRTSLFNETQLDQLAGYGVWIVGIDSINGDIVTRHALTTDVSDLDHQEEMIRVNFDSISYVARRWFSPFVGKANVSDDLKTRFEVELDAMQDYLKNVGRTETLGSQASELADRRVERHPFLRDSMEISFNPITPVPLNYPRVHIVI